LTPAHRRDEPRGVSLADLVIGVPGLAIGLALQPVRLEPTRVVQTCGFAAPVVTYSSAYWTAARVALPLALALALAIVARRARYGGWPRPSEWLGLWVALVMLDPAVAGSDHVGGPVTTRPMTYVEVRGIQVPTREIRPTVLIDLDDERPLVSVLLTSAAVGALAILAARILAATVSRGLPAWAGVVLILVAGWAWLRVPIRLNPREIVRFRYSWLNVRPVLQRTAFQLHIELRLALGRMAEGIIFGTLLVAALRDLWRSGRPSWRGTELTAVALAAALAGCWAVDELLLRPAPGAWVRGPVFLGWLVAVGVPALLLGGRLPLDRRPRRGAPS
jgi:hypothetical protein